MADNYLERHREQYEQRKQKYEACKRQLSPELRKKIADRRKEQK